MDLFWLHHDKNNKSQLFVRMQYKWVFLLHTQLTWLQNVQKLWDLASIKTNVVSIFWSVIDFMQGLMNNTPQIQIWSQSCSFGKEKLS